MTPSPTPNPADLGELVADLQRLTDPEVRWQIIPLGRAARKAADALAAQQREIEGLNSECQASMVTIAEERARTEALEKEREIVDGALEQAVEALEFRTVQRDEARSRADKAEAEVAALKAKLQDIGEFCSGDDTALGALQRLAQIQTIARTQIEGEGP